MENAFAKTNPTQLLQERQAARGPNSERAELIGKFFAKQCIRIRDRKTKELRIATAKEIAIKLSLIPTGDLYAFYRQCEQARSFSKYFWWALKPKS